MNEYAINEERPHEDFQKRFGEWIECGKCRALMFDTFLSCWSCGTPMNERTKISVRL